MNNELDYLTDVLLHRAEVKENLEYFISELRARGIAHDRTKLQEPEFSAYVSTQEKFKKADYGSKEYEECCQAIKPAIEHHYKNNRHHTNYHENGINDMTLIDILEMLADWKAAERRSPNKNLEDSLGYAFKKYGIGDQLGILIKNTLFDVGAI